MGICSLISRILSYEKVENRKDMGACSSVGGQKEKVGGYDITVQKQIAEGGFSYIYRCKDQKGKTLCLKKIPAGDKEKYDNALLEIKMFNVVKECKGFLPLLASKTVSLRGTKEVWLIFPLMEKSLFRHVADTGAIPEADAIRITLIICRALVELHSKGFIHGDLKPENILLGKNLSSPCLCDMASCRPIKRTPATRAEALRIQEDAETYSTPAYRAPELHDVKTGAEVDGKIDVFALGCTLYFAAFGRNPFDDPEQGFLKLALMQGNAPFPKEMKSNCKSIVKKMLRSDVAKRISIETCATKLDSLLGKVKSSEKKDVPPKED
mmetsp:Transcript_7586/g.11483  ORF Transcript_7586/g.11483 Transcript_7586/m.11483 type:complete len:324 (+) Transcript_7586:48-1019(+)